MPHFICTTCGTQFAETPHPPACCAICEDERQYVGWGGQQWTTLDQLSRRYRNRIRPEGGGLTGIGTEPTFAIGQRALLVPSPQGNILWDCISLVDDETIAAVRALGGVAAIAISHPHYYSSMVEWSRAFGGVPVYLHADDSRWVMRPDQCIEFWESEVRNLGGGRTLIRCSGHFAGGTVLHRAGNGGVLLSGDIIQVVQDRRWVSFMYSYPNLIPLSPAQVRRILNAVEPFEFDSVYGAWFDRNIRGDAKAAVKRSAERYIRFVDGA